jgi:hypothetical protein
VAAFDSALGTIRVLGAALHGRDLPRLGQGPAAAAAVRASGLLPRALRRRVYARAGAAEGVPPEALGTVDLAAVAQHLTSHYPRRRYPAVLIGSANGGMTHLAAAAQIPWLPQTVLVPVRWPDNRPDRPDRALIWGRGVAAPLLEHNPDVELHHMHDGNQDELMVTEMAYFRCKWIDLPKAYLYFLQHCLEPQAPLILIRGSLQWPITQVADRHVFQNGAYGGLSPQDYMSMPHAPAVDHECAEAEWGTTTAFEHAVRAWAARSKHPVLEISADDPQHLAERAASTALAWRCSLQEQPPSVIVDQFIQTQPWHTLRTGAVPFWTVFPVRHCADAAEQWLQNKGPFTRVDVALFNHGTRSAGLADIDRWRALTRTGRTAGAVLGQRPRAFPADFAALVNATAAMRRLPDGPPWPLLPITRLADLASGVHRPDR